MIIVIIVIVVIAIAAAGVFLVPSTNRWIKKNIFYKLGLYNGSPTADQVTKKARYEETTIVSIDIMNTGVVSSTQMSMTTLEITTKDITTLTAVDPQVNLIHQSVTPGVVVTNTALTACRGLTLPLTHWMRFWPKTHLGILTFKFVQADYNSTYANYSITLYNDAIVPVYSGILSGDTITLTPTNKLMNPNSKMIDSIKFTASQTTGYMFLITEMDFFNGYGFPIDKSTITTTISSDGSLRAASSINGNYNDTTDWTVLNGVTGNMTLKFPAPVDLSGLWMLHPYINYHMAVGAKIEFFNGTTLVKTETLTTALRARLIKL